MIAAETEAAPLDEEVVSTAGAGWLGGADCTLIVKPSPVPKAADVERSLEARRS